MSRRILLSVVLVLASACSSESGSFHAEGAPTMEVAPTAPDMSPQSTGAVGVSGPTTNPIRARDVVRTANVHLRAARPANVVDRARHWVEAHEGFVDDASSTGAGTATASSRATFRVPSARYGEALRELRSLATVLEVSEHGEDVTAVRADADARIAAKRALEQRLLGLSQHTGSVAELIQVENELGRVRGDIEAMEATQRALLDRIAYATITLAIDSPAQPIVARAESFGSRLDRSFTSGMRAAEGLVTGTVALIAALSPLLVLSFFAYGIVRIARRRAATGVRSAA